jgi:plasmid stabilization system protein ParE
LRVRLTALAIGDIEQARDWHNSQNPGLGAVFVARVDEAMQWIAANPAMYQIVVGDIRRARLAQFPYGIFYRVEPDEAVVVACLHYRRNPDLVARRGRAAPRR